MTVFAEIAALAGTVPAFAWLAVAFAVREMQAGRRRGALNEALHELRRPLHALALSSGPAAPSAAALESTVRMAAAAVDRLEREINGGGVREARRRVVAREELESAVRRWRGRAALGGSTLGLRWGAGEAALDADPVALAQALDNLIVNALEHGGPSVRVEGRRCRGRLRIAVVDNGRAARPASRRGSPAETLRRLAGRRRHGHGLAVVRRVAAAHGGRFSMHGSEAGTTAMLELPLAAERGRG